MTEVTKGQTTHQETGDLNRFKRTSSFLPKSCRFSSTFYKDFQFFSAHPSPPRFPDLIEFLADKIWDETTFIDMLPPKSKYLNFQPMPLIKIVAYRPIFPVEVNPLKHGEGISESNWGDNLVHADAKGLHIPSYLAT